MARTPSPRPAPRKAAKAKATQPPPPFAAMPPLTAAAAVSDRTTVLYDPATGAVAGMHRVITLPGGAESPDPASAAEALEIAPAARGKLAMLRQDGAVPEDREITVALSAGKAKLSLVKRMTPKAKT
jgi:hypothetical protein